MVSAPQDRPPVRHTRRIPDKSLFFDLVVPGLFVVFAILLVLIVVFALGVLTGVIHYQ